MPKLQGINHYKRDRQTLSTEGAELLKEVVR
jgi:hypothetical protein